MNGTDSPHDLWFGSKGTPLQVALKGYNTFFNLLNSREEFAQRVLRDAAVYLDSNEPTRFLLAGSVDLFEKCGNDRRFFQLARVSPALAPAFSLVLALNKASMIVDPIDWSSLSLQLRSWADSKQCNLIISELTDSVFRERILPNHSPRVRYSRSDPWALLSPSFSKTIPASSANLILKINKFDETLLVLGILPNQLRMLMKNHNVDHIEDTLNLLRDTLFWEGYTIWRKRKLLVKNFWQNVAPKEWKVNYKIPKSKHKRVMRQNCSSPFHFCEKICDLSKQRRTVCACSDVRKQTKRKDLPDIRTFLTKYPRHIHSMDGVVSYGGLSVAPPKLIVDALNRDDYVRMEHDRGKKKRKMSLDGIC